MFLSEVEQQYPRPGQGSAQSAEDAQQNTSAIAAFRGGLGSRLLYRLLLCLFRLGLRFVIRRFFLSGSCPGRSCPGFRVRGGGLCLRLIFRGLDGGSRGGGRGGGFL